MKFWLAAGVIGVAVSGAAFGANSFQCDYQGHKVTAELDFDARLLTVTRADGVSDKGFYIERRDPTAGYVEYYLPTYDGAYLRVWQDGERAEFEHCFSCGVFSCERSEFLGT